MMTGRHPPQPGGRMMSEAEYDELGAYVEETLQLRADVARLQDAADATRALQPCGHPREAIRSSPYTGIQVSNWCGWCEDVDAKFQELERMRRSISFIAAQLRDLLDPPAIRKANDGV